MPFTQRNWLSSRYVFLLCLLLGGSCATPQEQGPGFTIVAINDVYRLEGVDQNSSGGLARIRSLRAELEKDNPNVLLLHGGDFLFPSLLSRQFNGKQMVDVLNLLDGDPNGFDDRMFVTFGGHEFEKDKENEAGLLEARIQESQFSWLGSNIVFKQDRDGRSLIKADNLKDGAIMTIGGIQVGLFSLTTHSPPPAYVSRFRDATEVATQLSQELRHGGADFVIALTHQPISLDAAMLNALGPEGPDLVIGGYDHYRKSQKVSGRWILKADADARTATVVRVRLKEPNQFYIQWEFVRLTQGNYAPDPMVAKRVDDWIHRHNHEYCKAVFNQGPRCLNKILGKADIDLIGDELELRKYETNFGNWIADQALSAFADQGAQVAFINSGALRLNQDLLDQTLITRRDIEQTFAYPMPLKLLRIKGSTLQKIVSRSIEDWTGRSWWLQISGFAFRHDPTSQSADSLTLLTPDGPRPIKPDEELLAVTNSFLADGGDGYDWLPSQEVLNPEPFPDLKDVVIGSLLAELEEGIDPEVEGRICNTNRKGPCLAILQD